MVRAYPCFYRWVRWYIGAILLLCFSILAGQNVTGLSFEAGDEAYTISITEPFGIDGLEFVPTSAFSFSWDPIAEEFSLYGLGEISIADATFQLSLGVADDPGLTFRANGSLKSLNVAVTESFTLMGLDFDLGGGQTIALKYDPASRQFEFTGSLTVDLEGNSLDVGLGTDGDPGIIVQDGQLLHILLHVSADFAISGLAMQDPDVTIQWDRRQGEQVYKVYGQVALDFGDNTFGASLGGAETPGLVIADGQIQSLSLEVRAGAKLFDAFTTRDDFTLAYDKADKTFGLTGDILIGLSLGAYEPTVYLHADPEEGNGIVYHTDSRKLRVDNATFGIGGQGIEIGGFELRDLSVEIVNNRPDSIHAQALLPPGFLVDAELSFTTSGPFELKEVALSWQAEDPTDPLPMGQSGFYLVSLSGKLNNLDRPSRTIFDGSMGFIYGELVNLELVDEEVAIAYFETDVEISSSALSMEVIAQLGAALENDEWVGYLGTADVKADFVWGVEYSLTGQFNMLKEPEVVVANAEVHLYQNGDFNALAEVRLIVPKQVPIIGGKTFEKVAGAMLYKNGHPADSYAAGWLKINLGFDHIQIGAKVNLGNGHISKLGAGAAKSLTKTVESNAADNMQMPHTCTLHHTFQVEDPTPAYLQGQFVFLNEAKLAPSEYFPNGLSPITVSLSGPSGQVAYQQLSAAGDSIFVSAHNVLIYSWTYPALDTARFIAAEETAFSYSASSGYNLLPDVFLTPGQYTLQMSTTCKAGQDLTEDDFSVTISPSFPAPTIALSSYLAPGANGSVRLQIVYEIDYTAYLTEGATIASYWNSVPSYHGILVANTALSANTGGTQTHHFTPPVLTQDTLWVYSVIDDGVNPPVFTALQPVVFRDYFLRGRVRSPEGNPVAGVAIVLRETDANGSPSGFPPTATFTDAGGRFAFYNIEDEGTLVIDAYAPEDFSWDLKVSENGRPLAGTGRELKAPDWLRVTKSPVDTMLDLSLSRLVPSIYGAVLPSGVGSEVFSASRAGIVVTLWDTDTTIYAGTVTTEVGYVFYQIPEGVYQLRFSLPDSLHQSLHWNPYHRSNTADPFTVIYDGITYANTPLQVNGYVETGGTGPSFLIRLDDDDAPFPDLTVTLQALDGSQTLRMPTNSEGLATFEAADLKKFVAGDPSTSYRIQIGAPADYRPAPGQPTVLQWTGDPTPRLYRLQEQAIYGVVKLNAAGNPLVEGIIVSLLDADGAVVAVDTTDADGYAFHGIPYGGYTLRFALPFPPNTPNRHWSRADLNTNSLFYHEVEDVDYAGESLTVDATLQPGKSGPAFLVREENTGAGIGQATVRLTTDGAAPVTAATNAAGLAVFKAGDLQTGVVYNVNITFSEPHTITGGNNLIIWNGGIVTYVIDAETDILSGRVRLDVAGSGPSLAGIVVNLFDGDNALVASTVTDTTGYAFPGLSHEKYDLRFVLPSELSSTYHWDPDELANTSDALVRVQKNVNYQGGILEKNATLYSGPTGPVFRVLGLTADQLQEVSITLVAPGVDSVRMTANTAGLVIFRARELVNNKAYTVHYDFPEGYILSVGGTSNLFWSNYPVNINVPVVQAQTSSIAGTVRLNAPTANKPGLAGVTVSLIGIDGTPVSSTTTDSGGDYAFGQVHLGAYSISFNLGPSSAYHWDPATLSLAGVPRNRVDTLTLTADPLTYSVLAEEGPRGPAFYLLNQENGGTFSGITVTLANGPRVRQATSNVHGLAVFTAEAVGEEYTYNLSLDLPPGYHISHTYPNGYESIFGWNQGSNDDISIYITRD